MEVAAGHAELDQGFSACNNPNTTHNRPAHRLARPEEGEEGGEEDTAFNTSHRESGLAYPLNTSSVTVAQVAETMIACQVAADSTVVIATTTFNPWRKRDILPIRA